MGMLNGVHSPCCSLSFEKSFATHWAQPRPLRIFYLLRWGKKKSFSWVFQRFCCRMLFCFHMVSILTWLLTSVKVRWYTCCFVVFFSWEQTGCVFRFATKYCCSWQQQDKVKNPRNSEMFIDAWCKCFVYFVTAGGGYSHSQAEFPLPWTDVLGQCALVFRYSDFLALHQEGLVWLWVRQVC